MFNSNTLQKLHFLIYLFPMPTRDDEGFPKRAVERPSTRVFFGKNVSQRIGSCDQKAKIHLPQFSNMTNFSQFILSNTERKGSHLPEILILK